MKTPKVNAVDIEIAQLLIDTFQPRMDVFAKRFDQQAEVDRYNAWLVKQPFKAPLAKLGGWKPTGKKRARKEVTVDAIARHVTGIETLGVYPLKPDGTTNVIGVDFDDHRGEVVVDADPRADYDATVTVLDRRGIPYLGWRSRGGRGYWIMLLLLPGTSARDARAVLHGVLREAGVKHIADGGTFDALFPKQDQPAPTNDDDPTGSPGNLYCLPLSRKWMANDPPGGVFVGVDPKDRDAQAAYLRAAQRITPEQWSELVKQYPVPEQPKDCTPRGAPKSRTNVTPPVDATSIWAIALRKVGRLGLELGDGKHAVWCINDAQHSEPDDSVENARGSCVLYPPCDERNLGYPGCSHAHCERLTLRDWIDAIGKENWVNAGLEARGMKRAGPYLMHPGGISGWKFQLVNEVDGEIVDSDDLTLEQISRLKQHTAIVPNKGELANFAAIIKSDIVESDGVEQRRLYEIEGRAPGRHKIFRIPATEFQSMAWVSAELGGAAILRHGRDTKDQVREAIQMFSQPIPERRTYTFTGWHEHDGKPVYLHARGGIGADGEVPGIDVQLEGRAKLFWLPPPPDSEELVRCVRASLDLLAIDPAEVMVLLLGIAYRAPIDTSPVTVYLSGEQTFGKSVVAGLMQSHYGPEWNEKRLPATWPLSTAAALNQFRSKIGHCPFAIDDFLLSGNSAKDQELQAKIDKVARNQHDGSGALRMSKDTRRTEDERPSRSTLLALGEQLPTGHSLRSRMIVGHVEQRITTDLTPHKAMARQGVYASAMAGYIRWLAARLKEIRSKKEEEIERLTKKFSTDHKDRRTAAMMADLAFGITTFLTFAGQVGAVHQDEFDRIERRAWDALKTVSKLQLEHQQQQDPVLRFLQLAGTAISSGYGHLTLPNGRMPGPAPGALGWSLQREFERPIGSNDEERHGVETIEDWRPSGRCLGVIDLEKQLVWLYRDMIAVAVNELAAKGNDPMPLAIEELVRRLHTKGLLAANDIKKRETYYVRKTIGGRNSPPLICLNAADIGLALAEPHLRMVGPGQR